MADTKLTAMTESTTPDKADPIYTVDDPAGTPVSRKMTFENAFKVIDTFTAQTSFDGTVDVVAVHVNSSGLIRKGTIRNLSAAMVNDVGTTTSDVLSASKVISLIDASTDGRDFKESVRVATTANGVITTAFANGQTVDGVVLVTGNRILLKSQTTVSENGIYTVEAAGAPTRSTDMATGSIGAGAYVFVEEGTVNADAGFLCSSNASASTVGTHSLVWVIDSTGQTNTASNVGVSGQGVFKQKTASDLELRKINAIEGVSVGLNGDVIELKSDINGLTTNDSVDTSADLVEFWDASAAAHRKTTVAKFLAFAIGTTSDLTVTAQVANYTAVAFDLVVCDATGGAFTVTMPAAPTLNDSIAIYVEHATALLTVTVNGNGKTLAEFGASKVLVTPGDLLTFQYDGTKWVVIAAYLDAKHLLTDGTRAGTGIQEFLGLNLTDSTELTIATGAVTVTQGYHTIDTEADSATDDLDTITVAGGEGDILILRPASSARTVVIKHGTGNIQCVEDFDITMDDDHEFVLLIRKNASDWMAWSGARRMPPYLDNGDTLGAELAGDVLYHDGTNWTNLRKGTDGQHLELTSGIPAWADLSAASTILSRVAATANVSRGGGGMSGASYASKSKLVSAESTVPSELAFSSDGTKCYVLDQSGTDSVYQYTLSSAWDISTASYASKSMAVDSEDLIPNGLAFSSDGTKCYMSGQTNNTVYQYTLSTPWDIGTGSYASKSMSFASEAGGGQAIQFNSTGTKCFLLLQQAVYQYTLSTPWDIGTGSYDPGETFSVATQLTVARGLAFRPDGLRFFATGNVEDKVFQYTVSTAWDLTTASYDGVEFDVSSQEATATGLAFRPDGSTFYVVGSTNDTIYQYTLPAASDPSPIDGATLADDDIVLLAGQDDLRQNGPYTAVTATDPSTWTRVSSLATAADASGRIVAVTEGNTYTATLWTCHTASGSDVVDTDDLTFVVTLTTPLNNYAGTTSPGTGDDSGDGYGVGSNWYDTTADDAWVCLDSTATAAVWKKTTP